MGCSCAELFLGLDTTIIGDENVEVSGLAYNSRDVKPGDVFFCIVGKTVDGHTFAQDAIDKGASIIVVERPLYLADASNVTTVVTSDSRIAMAHAADVFYGHPSSKMKLVGITGTNGKTTVAYLVESISEKLGHKAGSIGTVGMSISGNMSKTEHTTPESIELQEMLSVMAKSNCEVVAMEVSSHALDLLRVAKCNFSVTAFTNLTHEHLDYHRTMQGYFEAKAKLFSEDYPAKRVINIESDWGRKLAEQCHAAGDDVITYGFSEKADIYATDVNCMPEKTTATLIVQGQKYSLNLPLVGRYNVENAMCAIGICLQLGFLIDGILEAIAEPVSVPGRLEHVYIGGGSDIYAIVDYAHTPDALAKALTAVKETTDGHVILVFGCEGDRDKAKRPVMGEISLNADLVVLTTDNIHTEDRMSIIDEVLGGMTSGHRMSENDSAEDIWRQAEIGPTPYVMIPMRVDAFEFATSIARAGDTVLFTGRGHEDNESIGNETFHLDDREEAAKALLKRRTH